MNKQDLIKGEYYYAEYDKTLQMPGFCIILTGENNSFRNSKGIYTEFFSYYKENSFETSKNIRLATSEEKHWLSKCIELNKFISKEEAMKSFIPEYVKLIGDSCWNVLKGEICKVKEKTGNLYTLFEAKTTPDMPSGHGLHFYITELLIVPSTKEEYDAQFIVKKQYKGVHVKTQDEFNYAYCKINGYSDIQIKNFKQVEIYGECILYFKTQGFDSIGNHLEEAQPFEEWLLKKGYTDFKSKEPKFVLPKKWCIKVTKENIDEILNINHNFKIACNRDKQMILRNNYYLIKSNDTGYKLIFNDVIYTEITFEQFKKYVLNED